MPDTKQVTEPALTPEDCITHRGEGCAGKVEYRMSLSGTGIPYPRCDKAWEERLDLEDGLRERYPDSDTPPPGFDPSYAGESWSDD